MSYYYPAGFQTIDELLQHVYGRTPGEVRKAAGGLSTATDGIYNPVYGGQIWANFNLEANVFAAFPKYVWARSGWRIFTEKSGDIADAANPGAADASSTLNNTTLGGTVEGGLVPNAVRPLVKQVSVRPKTLVYPFRVTEIQDHLTTLSQDDNWGHMGQQRVYASAQYKENINRQLLLNVSNINSEANDIASRLNMESIDRIISSEAESSLSTRQVEGTNFGKYNPWINVVPDNESTDGAGGRAFTLSDVNGYGDDQVIDEAGIDRTLDTASSSSNGVGRFDTTVTSPSGTLGTEETLTDGVIRDFLSDIRPTGGKDPSIFFGGHKTYSELQGIYVKSVRIQNPSDTDAVVTVGVNGINTFRGNGVGLHISKVYDIPFIPSKDVPGARDNRFTGNTTSIGNLYALDTSDPEKYGVPRFGIRVLKPPVYYEVSPRIPGFPFITGGFVDRGIFESIMECTASQLKTQGKIRDIRRS